MQGESLHTASCQGADSDSPTNAISRRQMVQHLLVAESSIFLAGCAHDNPTGGEGDRTTFDRDETASPVPTPTHSPIPTREKPSSPGQGLNATPTQTTDSDGDGVADDHDDYPRNEHLTDLVAKIDEVVTLERDHYRNHPIELRGDGGLRYEFVVKTGPKIHFYTMNRADFLAFKQGEEFQFIPELTSESAFEGKDSAGLRAEEYEVVLYNPDSGSSAATIDYYIEAGY